MSFIHVSSQSDFSIENLPYGVFSSRDNVSSSVCKVFLMCVRFSFEKHSLTFLPSSLGSRRPDRVWPSGKNCLIWLKCCICSIPSWSIQVEPKSCSTDRIWTHLSTRIHKSGTRCASSCVPFWTQPIRCCEMIKSFVNAVFTTRLKFECIFPSKLVSRSKLPLEPAKWPFFTFSFGRRRWLHGLLFIKRTRTKRRRDVPWKGQCIVRKLVTFAGRLSWPCLVGSCFRYL